MTAPIHEQFPNLYGFLAGYFYADWALDDPDAEAVINRYCQEASDEDVKRVVDEIGQFVKLPMTEGQHEKAPWYGLQCNYDPAAEGMTCSEWLQWVKSRLQLGKRMNESYLALQVIMMPRDANPIPTMLHDSGQNALYSTIFGGVILSYLDQAGAIGGRREVVRAGGPLPVLVTVAMNQVEFRQPVLVGDVVRFVTRLVRLGRTSITMRVDVEAERGDRVLQVTTAEVVYVGIDATSPERRPVPLLPDRGTVV